MPVVWNYQFFSVRSCKPSLTVLVGMHFWAQRRWRSNLYDRWPDRAVSSL